jgi:hypothetical protein
MEKDCTILSQALIVMALLLGGCMTSYTQPPKTVPHATIEVDLLPSGDADVREVRATLWDVDGVPVRWVRTRYRLAPGQRTLVWETVTVRRVHAPLLLDLLLVIKEDEVNEPENIRIDTSFVTNTVIIEAKGVYYFDGQYTRSLR